MDFRDYDEAVAELEDKWFEFRFGGEDFKANLNIDGGLMLRWLERSTDRVNGAAALPELLRHVMADDYDRLLATKQPWPKYEALMLDVFEHLGGSGNAESPDSESS